MDLEHVEVVMQGNEEDLVEVQMAVVIYDCRFEGEGI